MSSINKVVLGPDTVSITWNIRCGEESSLSLELFEEDGVTPLSSDGWLFVISIYNKSDHNFFDIPYTLKNGVLTATASTDVTNSLSRPENIPLKTLPFDIQGFKDGIKVYGKEDSFGVWAAVMGEVKAFSNQNN